MILDGKLVSDSVLNNLKVKINKIDNVLTLAIIQIGEDLASNVYISQKEKMCKKLNICFKHIKFSSDVLEDIVIEEINNLNKDSKITAVLLQLPIPNHLNVIKLQNQIDYKKDVDGLNQENVIKLINNEKCLLPCTAKGILSLLEYYNININGKNIVIVGRSNLVGKPLFNLLLNKDATVTICHSKTKNLKKITTSSEILIVAAGVKHLIKEDMVNKDSVVIDVGINKENNELYGDVDTKNVIKHVKYISPVPGGVGPMTICSLAENIYEAYLLQK